MDTINKVTTAIPVIIIRLYQLIVSPVTQSSCRHIPSCSEYAMEALKEHGLLVGLYYSVKRIFSCRPGGSSGYHPVPKKEQKKYEQYDFFI